tara:strand:+ start:51 stop:1094 length:1044 start_codon:yes stop_codon:yes gene_type:complete
MVKKIIGNKIQKGGGQDGGGFFDNPSFEGFLKDTEEFIQFGNDKILKVINESYNKSANFFNVIPRIILFYFSIIIIILEVLLSILWNIPFGIGNFIKSFTSSWVLPKETYFYLYSFFKSIFIIIVLLSLIFVGNGLYQLTDIKKYDYPILVVKACLMYGVYLIDVFSYIIHLAIIDAFYRKRCLFDQESSSKKNPNKSSIINYIKTIVISLMILSLLYIFIYKLLINGQSSKFGLIVFTLTIMYFIVLYISDYIEKDISDLILFWFGLANGENTDNGFFPKCVGDDNSECDNTFMSTGYSIAINLFKSFIYICACISILWVQKNREMADMFRNFIKITLDNIEKRIE